MFKTRVFGYCAAQARKEEARRRQELEDLKEDASSTSFSPWSNEPLRRPPRKRPPDDNLRFRSEVEFVDNSNLTFPQFLVSLTHPFIISSLN